GGYIRPDNELRPAWQPPIPIPAPQMTTERNQNGTSSKPIENTHKLPNATVHVRTLSTPKRSATGAVSKDPRMTPAAYIDAPKIAWEGFAPLPCRIAGVHSRIK